ncbi:MAG: glutaredoxin 3 [Chromatiales bacterium]|jgi:glutaredoxin 3|nr:glutaredoxin 3 [Chromatiales bacterium]MDH4031550.1 glutaredoxin 3 [Chromatiales bacterium]
MNAGKAHADVVVYGTRLCGYCRRARDLLVSRGIEFEERAVDSDLEKRREMESLSGRRTVPQIFIDGRPIGGYDALRALDTSGRLDCLVFRDAADRP